MKTRQPTGKAPWPITLIAGPEKTGKSYACAVASGDPRIDRTLWISVGEDDPDEYGAIPGARFEIVEHDGTIRGIEQAVVDAVSEPGTNLVVVDSIGQLWEMLSNAAQAEANKRAAEKAKKYGGKVSGEDVQVGMDLWNRAKTTHRRIVNTLKTNDGPVLVTARLDLVTVMDEQGKPTKDKESKIKAEKSLGFDATVIIEIHERGKATMTGARSLKIDPQARIPLKDFTVTNLWDWLGVGQSAGVRHFSPRDGSEQTSAPVEPAHAGPQSLDALIPEPS